jgi:hypothetical protein
MRDDIESRLLAMIEADTATKHWYFKR